MPFQPIVVSTVFAATAFVAAAGPQAVASNPGLGEVQVTAQADQLWSFGGTARYICDWADEEKDMYVSGLVEADSRSEALKMAREAGRAQAARRGRVVSVYIDTLW